jgi:hypothetical protein
MSASRWAMVGRIRLCFLRRIGSGGHPVDADQAPRRWAAITATGISAYAPDYAGTPRNLDHETIAGRIRIVERFLEVTNEFPWTWTSGMAEELFSDLRSLRGRKQSTIRGYQNALRLFCTYVSHPDYGWDRVCEQRFGADPAQVFFDWNTAAHVQDNEQSPAKRAFTKRELQDFFDHADDQVPLIAASGRKGWLPAYRDAVMFKLAYSDGLFSRVQTPCGSVVL